jgi:hypothetical protein
MQQHMARARGPRLGRLGSRRTSDVPRWRAPRPAHARTQSEESPPCCPFINRAGRARVKGHTTHESKLTVRCLTMSCMVLRGTQELQIA